LGPHDGGGILSLTAMWAVASSNLWMSWCSGAVSWEEQEVTFSGAVMIFPAVAKSR
jgi:hypothetical protein